MPEQKIDKSSLWYVWQKEIDKHLVLVWLLNGVFNRSWLYLCQFKPFLVFCMVACVLYGWKDGYQPFFSLYHYPFPIRGWRWVGDELETRCSSFFNFFRLVKEGGSMRLKFFSRVKNQRFCCRSHSWIKYFLAVLPTWRGIEMCI